jgi:hypothetical protein
LVIFRVYVNLPGGRSGHFRVVFPDFNRSVSGSDTFKNSFFIQKTYPEWGI